MAVKRKAKSKVQNGEGFWDVMRSIGRVVKRGKLISKGLALIPHPAAKAAAAVADQVGVGKTKTRPRAKPKAKSTRGKGKKVRGLVL